MRCPKCYTETQPEANHCPGCQLPTPKGKVVAAAEKAKRRAAKKDAAYSLNRYSTDGKAISWKALLPARSRSIYALIVVLLLGGGGYGAYWYVNSSSPSMDAKAALTAMNQLRRLPSKTNGKTIDEVMTAELKRSREAGELVGYEGWMVKPYTSSSFLVSFSYEEKSGKKRAEWVVGKSDNTFVPHSELAANVHR